jgi:hypothetical protein
MKRVFEELDGGDWLFSHLGRIIKGEKALCTC